MEKTRRKGENIFNSEENLMAFMEEKVEQAKKDSLTELGECFENI